MKAVLISIQPKWCEKIFNGQKTIEVRKTRPKIYMPFKCYIYETKAQFIKSVKGACTSYDYGRGKVIGEFVCDEIDAYTFSNYEAQYRINDVDLMKTCLNFPELIAYGKGKILYGWNISNLKIYDKPRELGEFYTKCDKTGNDECGDCLYLQVMINSYPCDDSVDTWCGVDNKKPLSRPPQSWCYIEV